MLRVIGIDPGTISIDLCGLEDGRLFLDRSLPAADALDDPSFLVALLQAHAPLDLIAGPSGYGLPLKAARDLTDADFKLAYLAPPGESGGIGGLRAVVRALAASRLPVVLTPGVIHLASVPPHRKINRVDMGTADKVCAAALAVMEHATRSGCTEREATFVLLELGGAFTAALAVRNGAIVDGIAGSAGPLGARAAGALDGEVAFLAGAISKRMVFEGGVASIVGDKAGDPLELLALKTTSGEIAFQAFLESAVKGAVSAMVSLADDRTSRRSIDIILSGRLAGLPELRDGLAKRLAPFIGDGTIHVLAGFATTAKHAAQGAALLADGLAGGSSSGLIDALGIRNARGSVLDHLHLISPQAARARLGI